MTCHTYTCTLHRGALEPASVSRARRSSIHLPMRPLVAAFRAALLLGALGFLLLGLTVQGGKMGDAEVHTCVRTVCPLLESKQRE